MCVGAHRPGRVSRSFLLYPSASVCAYLPLVALSPALCPGSPFSVPRSLAHPSSRPQALTPRCDLSKAAESNEKSVLSVPLAWPLSAGLSAPSAWPLSALRSWNSLRATVSLFSQRRRTRRACNYAKVVVRLLERVHAF
ncbi:hypothetical protein C8Q70DRAFT_979781 [Cubamyces menziesii]|nr:hypothetical protein C8Q70DRAFT_1041228 [Cubamyces menziesii]KAI0660255.1 hypothetical protein C8Q70DRAFT_979781 [Cubamyces menziesii]